MSVFSTNCPACGGAFAAQEEWVGRLTNCPHCNKQITIAQSQDPNISIICPKCSASVTSKKSWLGMMVKCPSCKNDFIAADNQQSPAAQGAIGKAPVPVKAVPVSVNAIGNAPVPVKAVPVSVNATGNAPVPVKAVPVSVAGAVHAKMPANAPVPIQVQGGFAQAPTVNQANTVAATANKMQTPIAITPVNAGVNPVQKKKGSGKLISCIIFCVVALLLAGGLLFGWKYLTNVTSSEKDSSADITAICRRFVQCIERGNISKASRSCTENFRDQLSKYQKGSNAGNSEKIITFDEIQSCDVESDDTAVVVAYNNKTNSKISFLLVKSYDNEQVWLIDDITVD